MRSSASICAALCLVLGIGACGSERKTDTAPKSASSGSDRAASSAKLDQKAETAAAAACLSHFAKKLSGIRLDGRPAVAATLPTRNVIAMAMYGPAGGARAGEVRTLKANPTYSAYNSPDDKILVVFVRKVRPGSPDFAAGDTCQRAASAAGR